MAEEHVARVFKSGNSTAIRLPKGLGVTVGQKFVMVKHSDERITFVPADRRREHFIGLAGSLSEGWMKEGRMSSDQERRDPDRADRAA